jgi:asparagine synthase (glutamine-hydrolysing)
MLSQLYPQYRGPDGQLFADPLAAAGPQPHVNLAEVARLFSGVGLTGEFLPGSLWQGVALVWPAPVARPAGVPLVEVFSGVVQDLCAEAETIGISLSGGLDSLAVLVHVAHLRPARRTIAFVADLEDDGSERAALAVAKLLADLGLDIELVVVDPAAATAVPAWSPCGPRFDALPRVNATVAELAAERGVEVLLSGNGADELLAAPSYATAETARCWGLRGARRYVADLARTRQGRWGELAAVLARVLPAGLSARAYWAANWPDLCRPTTSPCLAEPYRPAALAWAEEWVQARLAEHADARRSWTAADILDTFWPRGLIPAAGTVPEASPFLHPDFVAAAFALPAAERYDPHAASAYHRIKAQVIGLYPPELRPALPNAKRYYTRALAEVASTNRTVPIATAAGLLDPDAVVANRDTMTGLTVAAVESWLAGCPVELG